MSVELGQVISLPRPMSWPEAQRALRRIPVFLALSAIGRDPTTCPICGSALAFTEAGRWARCRRCPVRGRAPDFVRVGMAAGFRDALKILAPLVGLSADEVLAAHAHHVAERRAAPWDPNGELVSRGRAWLTAALAADGADALLKRMRTEVEEALGQLETETIARRPP